jgi:peroxiredoxin
MPSVQRAHEALQDQDAVVLTISVDGGGMSAVKPYIAKHGYTVPTLIDTGMEVARKFRARGVPTTYIVDRQGKIVASGFGPINFDRPEFREYIQALLAQPGR